MNQKTTLIAFCLLLFAIQSYSQNMIFGTEHLNRYLNNPAAISETDSIKINIRGAQYDGITFDKSNFSTGTEFLYAPADANSSFMAGYRFSRMYEFYKLHSAVLGYAYKFSLKKDYSLSLGVSFTGENYREHPNYMYFGRPVEGFIYNVSPGAVFQMKNLRFSASANISHADLVQLDYGSSVSNPIVRAPYWSGANALISYNIKLSPRVHLEPHFSTTTYSYPNNSADSESIWFYDFGSLVSIKDFMRAGAGYYLSKEITEYLYFFSTFKVLEFMDVSGLCSIPMSPLSASSPNFSLQLGFRM